MLKQHSNATECNPLIPTDIWIAPESAVTWILHPSTSSLWHYQFDFATSPVPPWQTLKHFPAILTLKNILETIIHSIEKVCKVNYNGGSHAPSDITTNTKVPTKYSESSL